MWGQSQASLYRHPGSSNTAHREAGKEARSWLCSPSKQGRGLQRKKKKRGPEVKVLRAGLLDGFKEEISSFTALFTGSWRMSLWFQVPAALVGDVLGQ